MTGFNARLRSLRPSPGSRSLRRSGVGLAVAAAQESCRATALTALSPWPKRPIDSRCFSSSLYGR